jgi:hypothetical protein
MGDINTKAKNALKNVSMIMRVKSNIEDICELNDSREKRDSEEDKLQMIVRK